MSDTRPSKDRATGSRKRVEACVHPWEHVGINADGHPFCAECGTNLTKDPPWKDVPDPPADTVPMPQNEEQAELMQKLGYMWLKEHAPHRLAQPPRVCPDCREPLPAHWSFSKCPQHMTAQPPNVPRWRCVSYCICKPVDASHGHFVRDDEKGVWVRYEDLRPSLTKSEGAT